MVIYKYINKSTLLLALSAWLFGNTAVAQEVSCDFDPSKWTECAAIYGVTGSEVGTPAPSSINCVKLNPQNQLIKQIIINLKDPIMFTGLIDAIRSYNPYNKESLIRLHGASTLENQGGLCVGGTGVVSGMSIGLLTSFKPGSNRK